MNILVTGAKGFIGKNFVTTLNNIASKKANNYPINSNINVFSVDTDTSFEELERYCDLADVVVHLAGVNRPINNEDFMKGNFGFTGQLLKILNNRKIKFILSSSIQADLDNDYGKSKKAAEELLLEYGKNSGSEIYIYRLPNAFGKWCRPNYNSAIATFCHNIANELPIVINNSETELSLVYIDDIVNEFISAIAGEPNKTSEFCTVQPIYKAKLGKIASILQNFKNMRENLNVPNLNDEFEKKLYSTYLSYIPKDKLSYPLTMKSDYRGSFTEIIKTEKSGQFSVNISKAHITKGNHWHHSKNEKFLVVHGKGCIRFRKIGEDEVIEYFVSGEKLEVVDIPTGYTHNIENLGDTDMVTFMWSNECFDPNNPDTYFEEV